MSKLFDSSKHQRIVYIVQEHMYIEAKLGVAVGFGILFSINGTDETLWMRIVTFKYYLFDQIWSARILLLCT